MIFHFHSNFVSFKLLNLQLNFHINKTKKMINKQNKEKIIKL